MDGKQNDKMKLHLLLQQINMTDDQFVVHFKNALLERVSVHRKSRVWQFNIQLEKLLPIEVYTIFNQRIREAFSAIATIQLNIVCKNPVVDESLIAGYWPFVIEELRDMSPPIRERLTSQKPSVTGGKLTFICMNDMELQTMKTKYGPLIADVFETFGFPRLAVDFQLTDDLNSAEEAQKAFLIERQAEEEEMARKALEDMQKREQSRKENDDVPSGPFQLGPAIKHDEPLMEIRNIQDEERSVTIEGYVFDTEVRELRSGRSLLTIKITDYTDSIIVKMFSRNEEDGKLMSSLKKGSWVRARGGIQNDTFVRDLIMMAQSIMEIPPVIRRDLAPDDRKRVELHAHTSMSQMDAVVSASALVEQAAKWGHPAVAITDHGNVQSFPEAYSAGKKHGIKVLFGMEANLVDDGVPIAYGEQHRKLEDDTFVVFDVETTGLSAVYNTIIELAAVKIKNGEVIDTFERFANPHEPISALITNLTGITDDMVKDAPDVDEVVRDYYEWIGDAVLVAHNASFDMGFLYEAYKKAGIPSITYPVIDTLELARFLHPELGNHRLNTLAKKYNIELTQHHRAIYDAEATGYLFIKLLEGAEAKGITHLDDFNKHIGEGDAYKRARPSHCTIIATDDVGMKNLFKLVSYSHMDYFYRVPRIPRSLLIKHRQGLLIGSGCSNGEVFEGLMQKSPEEVEEIAKFYDYIEIHPKAVYSHLIDMELIRDEWNMEDIMRKLIKLGKAVDIPVCATGNVHYIDETDATFREVLVRAQGGANPLNRHSLPEVHFRTTDEMLKEFSFLGEQVAEEIVIDNPRAILERVGDVKPIKDDLYTPEIEGADEEVKQLTYSMAHEIYGEELPEVVVERIEKELKSIIGHGFAVIYLISHKLVKRSLDDGYLVGSRGSVGSSLVATMMEITEVNPLPPHYVCPTCKKAEFFDDGSVSSGYDLPDKKCSDCDVLYTKDGQDIPFETFLGFEGDKVPDIDLNFSGEYQANAHNYTKELFGEDYVYRAGTIGTVAERTAYGYVRGYMNDNGVHFRGAEIDRLVIGCSGVKRSTGQHPGGIIVVPDTKDIFDFTPIQFPANDLNSAWKTTHFDFHSIENNLLKLDILGHDDPTMIRMLEDLSGIDPLTIPPDDEGVMKLFSGTESLGVTPEQIGTKTGTLGVPEFGTRFVRQMLEETKPTTFSELVQISGLSHGTDVWLGNAQELIKNKVCQLSDVIGCRDDIMVYLIYQGLKPATAFSIMESVRRGRGLTPEFEEAMRAQNVPNWYIESCKKIKYMFPKAHAAAYVLMALRIAYFKVHHPILYYSAYFTVRAADHDLLTVTKGSASIRAKIQEIDAKGLDASPKEKNLLTVLEIALEMCERGFSFAKPDLYKSDATTFVIDGDTLIPPFNAIPSLGTNVAQSIVEARKDGEFLSKEDLQQRGRVSKTVIEYMEELGCLEGMPDANQLSLF
ncbi:PolC-type DNA polymerase III [Sporosarcina pasteurii]|uniref:DNA polymerase III PolC-type n=1 Tax=Sporosarcina pasteurii TaxID=1474 RepID=A0A380BGI9_SPOPA|nr:PolC-type DNA polymerase III [Sporosarcina pasteurii]MDS9470618.1 PolC-type DNA polymerase III [Sporosarcina pasteurii]QBQ05695.1 PolC-type DNA polymerase III [Sporosarcina pasteurii]SUJ01188.1 DNA polymerase III polC-type [Sporosarcina pasteurii]